MKRLIFDLDNTLCVKGENDDYKDAKPVEGVIQKLLEYKKKGFEIVISTSRNVRSFNGNLGKINVYTLPIILDWLDKHCVPYDEVVVGKPWCGFEGFYIDDKAIRPSEFLDFTYEEILELLEREN